MRAYGRDRDQAEAIGPRSSKPTRTERVIQHANRMWTVREVVDPTTRAPVLIFSSDGLARRVRVYPPHWRNLSDDDLYRLSWSR